MPERNIKTPADADVAFHRMGMMIDTSALDQVKILMSDRFADILQKYIDLSPRYIQSIETAWQQHDAAGMIEGAHALRSCSLSMGARGVAMLADNVEMMAGSMPSDHRDFTVFGALIDSLKVAHNVTLREMREMLQKLDKSGA